MLSLSFLRNNIFTVDKFSGAKKEMKTIHRNVVDESTIRSNFNLRVEFIFFANQHQDDVPAFNDVYVTSAKYKLSPTFFPKLFIRVTSENWL